MNNIYKGRPTYFYIDHFLNLFFTQFVPTATKPSKVNFFDTGETAYQAYNNYIFVLWEELNLFDEPMCLPTWTIVHGSTIQIKFDFFPDIDSINFGFFVEISNKGLVSIRARYYLNNHGIYDKVYNLLTVYDLFSSPDRYKTWTKFRSIIEEEYKNYAALASQFKIKEGV